jgi:hypothetical protein
VVGGDRIDIVAPRRLQADRDIAAAKGGNGEGAAVGLARQIEGVGFRRAPALSHRLAHRPGQGGEEDLIVVKGQTLAQRAALYGGVGWPFRQPSHQRVATVRHIRDPVARSLQGPQHIDSAGRRIQPDAIAHAPVAVGVVREHQGDPPFTRRCAPQPGPVGGQRGGKIGAVGDRDIVHHVGLRRRVAPGPALEGNRARQDAAINFGQGDVHRDVAGRQATRTLAPGFFIAAGEHDLQYRAIGSVEGRRCTHRPRLRQREAGRVQDDVGFRCGEEFADRCIADRIPQAGGVNRQRIHALGVQCRDQGINGFQISGLHQRPV